MNIFDIKSGTLLLFVVVHLMLWMATGNGLFHYIGQFFTLLNLAERVTGRTLDQWRKLWWDEFKHEHKVHTEPKKPKIIHIAGGS
jgi:hypothetical protein